MTGDVRETTMRSPGLRNERGVALLIVLLVTALLIALVFEFSYATRISLNSAINFRNSQRAYFLARSGIYAFIKYGDKLRDFYIPQGEWGVVPMISSGDTEVRIKWEDETGKIKIADVKSDQVTQFMVRALFENKRIDTDVYSKMTDQTNEINKLSLLSGLHQYMNDEDFNKVAASLTVSPVPSHTININTASADVLQSLGISTGAVGLIVQERQKNPFKDKTLIPGIGDVKIYDVLVSSYLTVVPNNTYTVYAYAKVGDYEKQIEAIVNVANPLNPVFYYWRAL